MPQPTQGPQGILQQQSAQQGPQMAPGAPPQGDPMAQGQGDAESSPESDAAYQTAIDAIHTKLYDDKAAEGIAKAILAAPDPIKGVLDQASALLGIAEDVTQGSVPDELYLAFAMQLLADVLEIAQAAGVTLQGKEIAEITKQYLVGVVKDIGGDTTDVEKAMGDLNMDEVGAQLDQAGAEQ